ncbi:MAG TPA: hypothetical protein VE956_23065 [Nodularia sp. (in: cyanobacteria)]|nr:hypothetical protein [Nodularia sp. (in: cyanobacteria)]
MLRLNPAAKNNAEEELENEKSGFVVCRNFTVVEKLYDMRWLCMRMNKINGFLTELPYLISKGKAYQM